jgi:uncharacterized protein YdaU (DUF1376 family)
MHYYSFNISDWTLHTAHLSLVEEAIYSRLIDHYYDTESPIPKITQPVYRRLRMASESAIADQILAEFFVLCDDGWHHKRCDKEILAYHKKSGQNRLNGLNGGRPRKEPLTNNPQITQSVISGNPNITLTNNQELITNKNTKTLSSAEPPPEPDLTGTQIPDCPQLEIVGLYNSILATRGLTAVKPALWGGTRARHLSTRWRESENRQNLDWWKRWFEYIAGIPFLMGENQKNWTADFGWLLNRENFVKVCEGKYHA